MSLKRSREPLIGVLSHNEEAGGFDESQKPNSNTITSFHVSKNRQLVVFGSTNGTILLQATATKLFSTTKLPCHQKLTDAEDCAITCCEFSPDGSYIAACTKEGRIFIWCRTDIRKLRQQKRDEDLRQGQNLVQVDMNGSIDDSYGDDSYEDVVDEFNASRDSPMKSSTTNHFPSAPLSEEQDFSLNTLGGTPSKKPVQELSEFEKMRLEMLELLESPKGKDSPTKVLTPKGSPLLTKSTSTPSTPSTPSAATTINSPRLSPINANKSDSPKTPSIPAPTSSSVSPRSPPNSEQEEGVTKEVQNEEGDSESSSTSPVGSPASPIQLPSYMYDFAFNASNDSEPSSCYSCRFSPSGKYLCITSSSHAIMWDVEKRNSVSIMGHKKEVLACCWGNDDLTLVTGSADNTLSLWKYDEYFYPKNSDERGGQGWRHEWCFEGHSGPVNSVAYGGDSSSSSSKNCSTTNTGGFYSGGDLVPMFSSEAGSSGDGLVSAREDAKRGPYVVSSSWDGTVRVWCARTMCELSCCVVITPKRLEEQFVKLLCVATCPYNRDLVVAAEDGGACSVWNVKICKKVADLLPSGSGQGKAFQCTWLSQKEESSGKTKNVIDKTSDNQSEKLPLLLCCTSKSLLCWNGNDVLPEFKSIRYVWGRSVDQGENAVKVTGMSYSSSGKSIATSGSDGLVRIFDTFTGDLLWYHQPFDVEIEVCCVCVSQTVNDSMGYLIVGGEDGNIAYWKWDENSKERVISDCILFSAHDEAIICISVSQDGRVMCTGSWDCCCNIWSTTKLFLSDQEKSKLTNDEIKAESLVCQITGYDGWTKSIDISGGVRGGKIVVGADDGGVYLYSFANLFDVDAVIKGVPIDNTSNGASESSMVGIHCGPPIYSHTAAVNCVRYGMGGDIIASCSDDTTINVYSVIGKAIRYTIDETCGRDAVNTIEWGGATEKNVLYVGTADKLVRIFNGINRDLLCTLGGHEDEITSLVCDSGSGTQFVTGSADGTMKFWSLDTSALL
jgi:WD40 repeat protein